MSRPVGTKRVHELETLSGDIGDAVLLASKDEKEYKYPLSELTARRNYSTRSPIPLMINRVDLQTVHETKAEDPVVINQLQLQTALETKAEDPVVINRLQLQTVHTHKQVAPVVINRLGLSYAMKSTIDSPPTD